MNKFIGIGRLTGDPDVRVSGENKIARYTLAIDRMVKRDQSKPDQQTADFIGCVAFGRAADFVDAYLRKGMKIAVVGRIQTGKYTNKDGQTVYTTDVVVENHEFCEKRTGQTAQSTPPQPQQKPAQIKTDDVFVNIPEDIDIEVPFE